MTEIVELKDIIETGSYHFFCQACLVDRPASEQSPDERYCQGCYEFLCVEAFRISERPKWAPNPLAEPKRIIELNDNWLDGPVEEAIKELDQREKDRRAELKGKAPSAVPQNTHRTAPAVKRAVAKINKVVKHPLSDKPRGRPKTTAIVGVVAKIKELKNENMTTREIARVLQEEGTNISYSTVSRILNGQGALL